jgi:hypothetical protein
VEVKREEQKSTKGEKVALQEKPEEPEEQKEQEKTNNLLVFHSRLIILHICIYMWNIHGGVKKRYPEKTGITPIINMLIKGKVKLLSNSSLSGIIFQLTVDEEDSEYMDILDGKFVIPVTDYVFKIAYITKNPTNINYYYNRKFKKAEFELDFLNEARLQQKIWMESISGGRPPLCPSIVDLFFFDADEEEEEDEEEDEDEEEEEEEEASSRSVGGVGSSSSSISESDGSYGSEESDNSEYFETEISDTSDWTTYDSNYIRRLVLEQLEENEEDYEEDDEEEYPGKSFLNLFFKNLEEQERIEMIENIKMFNTIFKVHPFLKMGVIVMPMINNSDTLHDSLANTRNPVILSNIKSSIIAKIIRLFVDIGVIHMDLHKDNALVYLNREGLIDTTIIDFGRSSDLTNGIPDKYFNLEQKAIIMEKKTIALNNLGLLDITSTKSEKTKYISSVVSLIKEIFTTLNYQNPMNSIFSYLKGNTEMGVDVFNILKTTITPHQLIDPTTLAKRSVLPLEEINEFCTDGCIYSASKPIASHYIPNSIIPSLPRRILTEEEKQMRKLKKEKESRIKNKIKKERKRMHKEDMLEDLELEKLIQEDKNLLLRKQEQELEQARERDLQRQMQILMKMQRENEMPPPSPPTEAILPPSPPKMSPQEVKELTNKTVKPVKTTCRGTNCVVMGGKRRTKKFHRKSKNKKRMTRKTRRRKA